MSAPVSLPSRSQRSFTRQPRTSRYQARLFSRSFTVRDGAASRSRRVSGSRRTGSDQGLSSAGSSSPGLPPTAFFFVDMRALPRAPAQSPAIAPSVPSRLRLPGGCGQPRPALLFSGPVLRRVPGAAAFEAHPGVESAPPLVEADDARAAREAFAAVLREARGPAVGQADAEELAFVVVHVVVPAEGPHHVARLHERGKESAVEGGPAPSQEGGDSPVPGDLVVGDPVVVPDPQSVVATRVQEVER